MMDLKTVKLKEGTYGRVAREIITYGESMDDIVTRLLDELDEYRKAAKSKK